jgi:hypothetical protein
VAHTDELTVGVTSGVVSVVSPPSIAAASDVSGVALVLPTTCVVTTGELMLGSGMNQLAGASQDSGQSCGEESGAIGLTHG